MSNTTICAISTPQGTGGIAVIRISGCEAFAIADKIFVAKNGQKVAEMQANTVCFGNVATLDEVLVAVFHAPHTFTGEDTVEISCHGSIFIQQEILKLLLANGCTLARAGEFTQRAFLNGKMDLSQAEAVADVIASSSAAAHRVAMNQMRGGFSKELRALRAQLLDFVSLIELELDFNEEDVEFADRVRLLELADTIGVSLTKLVNSFSLGNVLKNGIPVVIVGETNVGKSTLLNHLLHEEKAIVSDVHGTTRDVIEDVVNVSGITFRFIDTAGIRDTTDEVELLGVERTFQKIDQASIVIWLVDATKFNKEIDTLADKIVPRTVHKKLLLVINKIDKLNMEEQLILEKEFLPQIKADHIYLSAKYHQNTEKLEAALLQAANLTRYNEQDVIVSNVRHHEALCKAHEAIRRAEEGLRTNLSGDFVAQDIRECMHYLGEITGEISTDEVLGNIFRKFCVGK
ncbi:tRNA uridine-5-carboxymethylaminomethyl(34) synthesis GTPase MnmE [Candidatus Symbiothrix dinenymphae]|uniref:tRNA uridine-5-carboxymethylaminomethyl(34) synthesis GTPase MnmE n=1 Tax=Candidatus Symbiothrix dinenymphae TaxID=467085 RepID=UPI0006C63CAD|nr:tRNA uridine-5-carboxymethylaminomethyl(34) synthesis GTPase MnmE [Candidatus Symbiothrix dinenymphae]GAP71456.1 GTPase and tRNA-U34 5-formylation enzyme TrmE [Candidatus Symbiothrix dinenymphae]